MATAWPTVTNRNVQYPMRIKLTAVSGATDTYDVTLVPGTVAAEGTAINASLFSTMGTVVSELQDSVSYTQLSAGAACTAMLEGDGATVRMWVPKPGAKSYSSATATASGLVLSMSVNGSIFSSISATIKDANIFGDMVRVRATLSTSASTTYAWYAGAAIIISGTITITLS